MADETPSPFSIDQHNLDEEWLRQAKLTRKAGIREADARHEHAKAKARLDVVEAELRRRIRADPGKHDLKDKPTEASITEVVMLDRSYQAALEEVNDAKHALDIASAETLAMVDRRKALERLVELLALDYYSERGMPHARTPGARERVHESAKDSARGRG